MADPVTTFQDALKIGEALIDAVAPPSIANNLKRRAAQEIAEKAIRERKRIEGTIKTQVSAKEKANKIIGQVAHQKATVPGYNPPKRKELEKVKELRPKEIKHPQVMPEGIQDLPRGKTVPADEPEETANRVDLDKLYDLTQKPKKLEDLYKAEAPAKGELDKPGEKALESIFGGEQGLKGKRLSDILQKATSPRSAMAQKIHEYNLLNLLEKRLGTVSKETDPKVKHIMQVPAKERAENLRQWEKLGDVAGKTTTALSLPVTIPASIAKELKTEIKTKTSKALGHPLSSEEKEYEEGGMSKSLERVGKRVKGGYGIGNLNQEAIEDVLSRKLDPENSTADMITKAAAHVLGFIEEVGIYPKVTFGKSFKPRAGDFKEPIGMVIKSHFPDLSPEVVSSLSEDVLKLASTHAGGINPQLHKSIPLAIRTIPKKPGFEQVKFINKSKLNPSLAKALEATGLSLDQPGKIPPLAPVLGKLKWGAGAPQEVGEKARLELGRFASEKERIESLASSMAKEVPDPKMRKKIAGLIELEYLKGKELPLNDPDFKRQLIKLEEGTLGKGKTFTPDEFNRGIETLSGKERQVADLFKKEMKLKRERGLAAGKEVKEVSGYVPRVPQRVGIKHLTTAEGRSGLAEKIKGIIEGRGQASKKKVKYGPSMKRSVQSNLGDLRNEKDIATIYYKDMNKDAWEIAASNIEKQAYDMIGSKVPSNIQEIPHGMTLYTPKYFGKPFVVDTETAKFLKEITKSDVVARLGKYTEKVMSYLKTSMVSYPGFVPRNIMGYMEFCYLSGIDPLKHANLGRRFMGAMDAIKKPTVGTPLGDMLRAGSLIEKMPKKIGMYDTKELVDWAAKTGVTGVGKVAYEMVPPWNVSAFSKTVNFFNPASKNNFMAKFVRSFGSKSEDAVRTNMFLDLIIRGATKEEASHVLNSVMFSGYEQSKLARAAGSLFPWANWTINSHTFLLNAGRSNPAKLFSLLRGEQVLSNMDIVDLEHAGPWLEQHQNDWFLWIPFARGEHSDAYGNQYKTRLGIRLQGLDPAQDLNNDFSYKGLLMTFVGGLWEVLPQLGGKLEALKEETKPWYVEKSRVNLVPTTPAYNGLFGLLEPTGITGLLEDRGVIKKAEDGNYLIDRNSKDLLRMLNPMVDRIMNLSAANPDQISRFITGISLYELKPEEEDAALRREAVERLYKLQEIEQSMKQSGYLPKQ